VCRQRPAHLSRCPRTRAVDVVALKCDSSAVTERRAHSKLTQHFGHRCIPSGCRCVDSEYQDIPVYSRFAGRAFQRPKLRTCFFVNLRRRAGDATRFTELVSIHKGHFSTISASIGLNGWCGAHNCLPMPFLDIFELAKYGSIPDRKPNSVIR
jgi:hypothetical protein